MADTIRAATDYLIDLSCQHKKPLTPLEVQKMLYFLEGLHLALVDAPLFDENFEAWQFGPALPSVWRRFKSFGPNTISPNVVDTKAKESLSDPVLRLIEFVYTLYSKFDPPSLVGLTHLPGTPWDDVRRAHGLGKTDNSNEVIDTDKISSWFKAKWEDSIKSSSDEINYYPVDRYKEWATA
jgi:uncharacterized phage-associated protein